MDNLLPTWLAYLLLAGFSILWIFLGFFLGRNNHSFEDHALAGRNIGLTMAVTTAVATWITSNTTMLAPQFVLQLGVWGALAYSTASLGLFLFAPLAQRIQEILPNAFTVGDFMRLRFGRLTWGIFLFFSLFYSLTWLLSMAMAGGILLESISGISYHVGMSVILFVCVLYTIRGGLKAVIATDFIQSVLILIGIVALGIGILQKVSIEEIYQQTATTEPLLLKIAFPAALIALFNNLLFGIGEIFHSNVWWSRAFSFRAGIGKKAYFLAGLIWLPVPIAAGFTALAASALGVNIPSPDMVGPLVALKVFGKVGAIVIFIIVFSSLASSIDSLLAATSDMFARDVLKNIFMPDLSENSMKKAAQLSTVAIALAVWFACLPRMGSLATVLFFAGPLVGSMIWPILAGLYWDRTNSKVATAAMVAGATVGLWSYFSIDWYTGALSATAVSMTIVVTGSLISSTHFDWKKLGSKL